MHYILFIAILIEFVYGFCTHFNLLLVNKSVEVTNKKIFLNFFNLWADQNTFHLFFFYLTFQVLYFLLYFRYLGQVKTLLFFCSVSLLSRFVTRFVNFFKKKKKGKTELQDDKQHEWCNFKCYVFNKIWINNSVFSK